MNEISVLNQDTLVEISKKLEKICDNLEKSKKCQICNSEYIIECCACNTLTCKCLEFIFDLSNNGIYEEYKYKINVCSINCFERNYKRIYLYKMYPCSFKDFVNYEIKKWIYLNK